VDRPLTEQQMKELRAASTRATITSTRFVNEYHWGDLRGDPARWMERYFDAFLYFASWGTHRLMLRLPSRALDLRTAKPYVTEHSFDARVEDGLTILEFLSEEEAGGEWYDEGHGALSSIIPLRADLAAGDHRALYLGWLLGVQNEEVEGDEPEPPVPPGLGKLTAGLRALADFLRIDEDLLAAAAERSPRADEPPTGDALARWITALPEAEKDRLLIGIAAGEDPQPRATLLRRFREASGETRTPGPESRTVAELLDAAERQAADRRRREAERKARKAARRAREEAEALDRRLNDLAGREEQAWREVERLVAEKQAGAYDRAVQVLRDLQALGARQGRGAEVLQRIQALSEAHARKWSFVDRLRHAGLIRASRSRQVAVRGMSNRDVDPGTGIRYL
jgi:hypothetical protein